MDPIPNSEKSKNPFKVQIDLGSLNEWYFNTINSTADETLKETKFRSGLAVALNSSSLPSENEKEWILQIGDDFLDTLKVYLTANYTDTYGPSGTIYALLDFQKSFNEKGLNFEFSKKSSEIAQLLNNMGYEAKSEKDGLVNEIKVGGLSDNREIVISMGTDNFEDAKELELIPEDVGDYGMQIAINDLSIDKNKFAADLKLFAEVFGAFVNSVYQVQGKRAPEKKLVLA